MQTQSLLELTEQMIEAALEAESRYQEGKETGRSYDFFDIIKPDVEKKTGFARFGLKRRLRLFRKTVRNTFIMHKFRPLQKISES